MQAVNVAGLVLFLNKTWVHEIGRIGRARGREFLCQLIENRFKSFRRRIGLDFCRRLQLLIRIFQNFLVFDFI